MRNKLTAHNNSTNSDLVLRAVLFTGALLTAPEVLAQHPRTQFPTTYPNGFSQDYRTKRGNENRVVRPRPVQKPRNQTSDNLPVLTPMPDSQIPGQPSVQAYYDHETGELLLRPIYIPPCEPVPQPAQRPPERAPPQLAQPRVSYRYYYVYPQESTGTGFCDFWRDLAGVFHQPKPTLVVEKVIEYPARKPYSHRPPADPNVRNRSNPSGYRHRH